MQKNYLAPMDTVMTLSRLSLHHCSTSYAKVALNIALLTLWDVQARKMEANWSLNPVLPSSNSLSDSSTTSHSTLRNNKTTCSIQLEEPRHFTKLWGHIKKSNHMLPLRSTYHTIKRYKKNKQEKGKNKININ